MGSSCIAVRSSCEAEELRGTQRGGAAQLDNFVTLPYTIAAVGAVAQMGERINRTDEARGSSPLSSMGGCRWQVVAGSVEPVLLHSATYSTTT